MQWVWIKPNHYPTNTHIITIKSYIQFDDKKGGMSHPTICNLSNFEKHLFESLILKAENMQYVQTFRLSIEQ